MPKEHTLTNNKATALAYALPKPSGRLHERHVVFIYMAEPRQLRCRDKATQSKHIPSDYPKSLDYPNPAPARSKLAFCFTEVTTFVLFYPKIILSSEDYSPEYGFRSLQRLISLAMVWMVSELVW